MIRWNLEKHQLGDQIVTHGFHCNTIKISLTNGISLYFDHCDVK